MEIYLLSDEQLRQEVRYLKIINNIKYRDIAEKLGIRFSSFSNWMCKQYCLSASKRKELEEIINEMK